jgi:catechol 2,3-dioxygenase-like lactoylglutathione lyase family enzyme
VPGESPHPRKNATVPLGHLGINVPDLVAAKAYYDKIMPLLGYEAFVSADLEFAYLPIDSKPGTYLFFYPSREAGEYSRHQAGLQHLAFIVRTRDAVHAVHELVRELGDTILESPQEFPQYHPGYYAVFWLDPFGHMLEAVCHRAT